MKKSSRTTMSYISVSIFLILLLFMCLSKGEAVSASSISNYIYTEEYFEEGLHVKAKEIVIQPLHACYIEHIGRKIVFSCTPNPSLFEHSKNNRSTKSFIE